MKKTSEYVSIGHPDRMADYISSFILDRVLVADPRARYAVEVQVKDDFVSLAGEMTSSVKLSDDFIRRCVREAVEEIGYTAAYADAWNRNGERHVIDPRRLDVAIHIGRQSRDIARGVDGGGWGDQGIFFGFASNDTMSMMPKDHAVAKAICHRLYDFALASNGEFGIDIKTQVSVEESGRITDVVVAIPCSTGDAGALKVYSFVSSLFLEDDPFIVVNGTGYYVTHSSVGDCGTTGRKLVVDFYGSGCRIGGGSPWTKDPSKADLAINLLARHLAVKELNKREGTRAVTVALSCCIGRPDIEATVWTKNEIPKSLTLSHFGPDRVASMFNLRAPRYAAACRFGLFAEFSELYQ